MRHFQVIIIGGGQAGLSASYGLKKKNINHLIIDRGEIGDTWEKLRWDSFCLVTPNWQCRLPGFPYKGNDPDGFMKKDEIVKYIKDYAAFFNPPVQEKTEVFRVFKDQDDGELFHVDTSNGKYTANSIIVAAGGYHKPNIPEFSKGISKEIIQLHSSTYKNTEQLQEGAVLVVGTGQSGAQIAEDLHLAGRKVYLSVGTAPRAPRRYRGKDVVEWLEKMGYYDVPIEEHAAGEQARHKTNHYVTGRDGGRDIDLRIRAREGMVLKSRWVALDNDVMHFANDLKQNLDNADATAERIKKSINAYIKENKIKAPEDAPYQPSWTPSKNGSRSMNIKHENIRTVIWATGFKVDFSWVDFPIYDNKGYPKYHRGVTEIPGLFFLGLPWLHTWGSGRFSHIAPDAIYLGKQVANFLDVAVQKTQ